MNIGVNWDAYDGRNIPSVKEQTAIFKANGITNTFIMALCDGFDETVAAIQGAGITVDTCHAPFRGINNIWIPGANGDAMLERLIKSVDCCARFGIETLVVHLSSGNICPHINDLGYSRFIQLMEYATLRDVKIAYENQRKLANLAFALEEFPQAGFCWDVGHEECFTAGRRFMPLFGDRLVALHIHDNMCRQEGDLHMIPFDGKIDFDRVTSSIASSSFEGTIMLEVASSVSGKYEDINAAQYYQQAAIAATRLRDSVVEKRKSL